MERLQDIVRNFVAERPVMAAHNQDPSAVMDLLRQEMNEAAEVIDNPEKLAQELPDILWFVATLANVSGINLYDAFELKLLRNLNKYPAALLQEGNYDEIIPFLRLNWEAIGGDTQFYADLKVEGT